MRYKEKEEQSSLFDCGILQPFKLGASNELEPKTSPPMTRTTRRTTCLAADILPEVYEPQLDDVLGPEGKSPGPAAVNTPVLSKRACSTGTPKTAKQRSVREYVSRYACRRTKNPVGRLRGPLASGCSISPDSQSVGSSNLRCGGVEPN
jgi:hypothetical protein